VCYLQKLEAIVIVDGMAGIPSSTHGALVPERIIASLRREGAVRDAHELRSDLW
jgi:hypothetical protein